MTSQTLKDAVAHFSPPVIVDGPSEMAILQDDLAGEPAFAIDTESNSLYAYQEEICLIQISVPGTDYLVDPLAGVDLTRLGQLFADPNVEKVFHAAEYDVMCFKRDYGFHFSNLFDTMWAARILGWRRFGLASVLEETFDVHTNKRYQRYNWGKRPLNPEALSYARLDTHYLLALRRLQREALVAQGRMEEAREAFAEIAASEPPWEDFKPRDFWDVKGAYDLSGRQQAVLRELSIWRDKVARRRDRPHFKVLHDRVLTALAKRGPRTRKQLLEVRGIKEYHARRYGKGILRAVDRGLQAPAPQRPPRPPRHSQEEMERYEALRSWRKKIAAERGVDVVVVMGNSVLWELAERVPRSIEDLTEIPGLGPWKRETYGEDLLRIIAR